MLRETLERRHKGFIPKMEQKLLSPGNFCGSLLILNAFINTILSLLRSYYFLLIHPKCWANVSSPPKNAQLCCIADDPNPVHILQQLALKGYGFR